MSNTPKIRILVVDDEESVRVTVAMLLRGRGYEVSIAEDGFDALLQMKNTLPELVVSDLNMPQMDGAEVLESWTASTELKDVPVLLVSARPELAQVVERYHVRASLAKPFDMDVLCAVMEQLLAHPEPPPDG